MNDFRIRELNPHTNEEIEWVARGMRQTLIEVLGEKRGTELYTMDWLIDRVKWHLNPKTTTAKIYLAENDSGLLGHAIARLERDESSTVYGYFSTLFVLPEARRKGLAHSFIDQVENWLRSKNVTRIVYNTAEDHAVLIRLFESNGFRIALREKEMVQLVKN